MVTFRASVFFGLIDGVVSEILGSDADLCKLRRSGGVRLSTMLAESAHETLSEDTDDSGGNEEGFDLHIDQSGEGGGGVVGVEGGKDQVSCERGLDGDLGGFAVTGFTDQDDIGVLAQEGA